MAASMKLALRRWGILWLTLLTVLGSWGCGGARSAAPAAAASQSQAEPAAAKLAEPPAKHSRGIFYEVRGGAATLFLLGSVHVGKRQFYPLDPPIEAAFKSADTLVLEVDLR